MLAINTRNMRKRADVPPRLLDDLPSASSNNPNASPPQTQSSLPLVASQMRRKRNHFASVLKDALEDKEIYDDLAMINRELKQDQLKHDPERERSKLERSKLERSKLVAQSAEVVPDNNRLTVDGKVFHRNQPVFIEHHELGKYPGTLLQFSQTEIVIKKSYSDGRVERLRYPVGFLMVIISFLFGGVIVFVYLFIVLQDRRIILKKRSISLKNNNNAGMR
jgi:hypothetical protein